MINVMFLCMCMESLIHIQMKSRNSADRTVCVMTIIGFFFQPCILEIHMHM
jgi:hypothetical protein